MRPGRIADLSRRLSGSAVHPGAIGVGEARRCTDQLQGLGATRHGGSARGESTGEGDGTRGAGTDGLVHVANDSPRPVGAHERWRLRAGARCRIVAPSPAETPPEMSEHSPEELALAQLLIESLNLEDLSPAQIEPEAPLFGEGLGLDSIDALELALAISKQYGFQLRSEGDQNRQIFASLRALSAYVEQNKTV